MSEGDGMAAIPYLTTDQMRAADRAMIEDYHCEPGCKLRIVTPLKV